MVSLAVVLLLLREDLDGPLHHPVRRQVGVHVEDLAVRPQHVDRPHALVVELHRGAEAEVDCHLSERSCHPATAKAHALDNSGCVEL